MSAVIKKRNLLPFFDMAYQVIGELLRRMAVEETWTVVMSYFVIFQGVF